VAYREEISTAVLALVCVWVAGCTEPVAQQVYPTVVTPPSNGQNITWPAATPPAPLKESIPAKPGDDYVWIPGRWIWRERSYIWNLGHWALPPHPGAKWVPDKWSPGHTTPDVPAHWE